MHKNRYITTEPTRTQIYRLTHNFASTSHHKKNDHLQQIALQYKCHVQHHSFHINTSFSRSGKCKSHETTVIINAVLSAFWLTHHNYGDEKSALTQVAHFILGCSPNLGKFCRFFNCFFILFLL